MSPEQKRKFNTAAGTTFLVSGMLAWAFAAYFAFSPAAPKPAPVYGGQVVDLQSCAMTLRALGFNDVTVQGDDVVLFEAVSSSPKEQLAKVSLAAPVCKLELKSFCMGEECARPGLSLVATKSAAMRQAAKSSVKPSLPAAKAAKAPPQGGHPPKAPAAKQ